MYTYIYLFYYYSLSFSLSLSLSYWFHIQIGAVQAVSREAYFTAIEGAGIDNNGGMPAEISTTNRHRLHGLRGRSMQVVHVSLSYMPIWQSLMKVTFVSLFFVGETSSKSIEAMVSSSLISA